MARAIIDSMPPISEYVFGTTNRGPYTDFDGATKRLRAQMREQLGCAGPSGRDSPNWASRTSTVNAFSVTAATRWSCTTFTGFLRRRSGPATATFATRCRRHLRKWED